MFPEWLQLQTSNLVGTLPIQSTIYKHKARSKLAKTRSRGYILNLRIAVNNSETAKAPGFNFILQIDCKEWNISSTKLGQKGTQSRLSDLLLNCANFSFFCNV